MNKKSEDFLSDLFDKVLEAFSSRRSYPYAIQSNINRDCVCMHIYRKISIMSIISGAFNRESLTKAMSQERLQLLKSNHPK
jgi:hypothetical protein